MAVKTRTRLLSKKVEFKKNQTVLVELPQDNLVRRLEFYMFLKTTTDSGDTKAVGTKNGDILNVIKRMRIRLNGADTIFDVDLRTYYEALKAEYGAAPAKSSAAIPNADSSSDMRVWWVIDFALIRNQLSDYSALVPANLLDSFELLIDWGDAADIYTTANDTYVNDDTQITLSVVEAYETTNDSSAINAIVSGLTKIYEGVEQTEWDQAYESFPADELPIPIRPVPARHLSHLLAGLNNITDLNPAFSNTVVQDFKLQNVQGGGEDIYLNNFRTASEIGRLDNQEDGHTSGIVYIDWADLRNGGLDNVNVDALKYKLTTATPTSSKKNALRVYKKYIPLAV